MLSDPGTINSDDEIENFSEDDEEEEDGDVYENKEERTMTEETSENYNEDFFMRPNVDFVDKNKYVKEYMSVDEPDNLTVAIEDAKKKIKKSSNASTRNDEREIIKKMNVKLTEKRKKRLDVLKKKEEKLAFKEVSSLSKENTGTTFLEMNLSPLLLKAIKVLNYDTPTPIQASTVPIAMQGRDICGCAATGTGKTAAYMLPILQKLIKRSKRTAITRVLVLVPTRELGVQVFEATESLTTFTNLVTALTVGGLNRTTQAEDLECNPDIIIATPGRLIDHMYNTKSFSLKQIEVLVLDEADQMLEHFFAEQLNEIVKDCAATRQTMLFSATMTVEVKALAAVSLVNPAKIFVNTSTEVAQNLRQEIVFVRKNDENRRLAALVYLLEHTFANQQILIFTSTWKMCHRLRATLGLLDFKISELHSRMSQKQRLASMFDFKAKKTNLLLATDVASRGLDIKGIEVVINYHVPISYQIYIHRVGRTARAGYSGRAVTFIDKSSLALLGKIKKYSLQSVFERVVIEENIEKYLIKMEKYEKLASTLLRNELMQKKFASQLKKVEELENMADQIENDEDPEPEVEIKWMDIKPKIQSQREKDRKKKLEKKSQADPSKNKMSNRKGKLKQNKSSSFIALNKSKGSHQKKNSKDFTISKFKNNKKQGIKSKKSFGNKSPKNRRSFVKDFTDTGSKNLKKLRAGPSYLEKKERYEMKNPGKKFKLKKK